MQLDKIERFRAILLKLRYPTAIYGFFCFSQSADLAYLTQFTNFDASGAATGHTGSDGLPSESGIAGEYYTMPAALKSHKEKGTDALAKFAKNTLRKAGLMPRTNNNNNSGGRKNNSASNNVSSMRTPETMRKIMHGQAAAESRNR